jgi:DNA invertase Pin-like site-specific DNA recombinase
VLGVLVGYARVSTQDQDPALQLDALKAAGCEKVFTEKASGAQRERPQLRAALDSTTCAPATRSLSGSWTGWPGR